MKIFNFRCLEGHQEREGGHQLQQVPGLEVHRSQLLAQALLQDHDIHMAFLQEVNQAHHQGQEVHKQLLHIQEDQPTHLHIQNVHAAPQNGLHQPRD